MGHSAIFNNLTRIQNIALLVLPMVHNQNKYVTDDIIFSNNYIAANNHKLT